MSRSSNRYVPISMPLPIGLPRAYYYAEENIPDFDENELESYNQWMESIPPPNNEREQNCPAPQSNGTGPQWPNKNQAAPTSADPSHREQRHHIQMHEASPSSDITELFRRKQEDRYGVTQEIIMAEDSSPRFFYRPTTVSRIGAQRVGLMERDRSVVSAPPLPSGPLLPHHIGYYQHEEHVGPPHHAYETLVFHSNPQLHRNNLIQKGNLHCPAQLVGENPNIITNVIRPNKPPSHMKPAVTVRTPRYFRRSGVFKRPSALCLPLSCELDPAVLQQRPMKTRLPSTMPAMQILSPTHRTLPQMRQMTAQDDDTSNTSRSAPPPYFEFLNDLDRNTPPGKPGKLDQSEIERIQQIIEQRTGVKDNQGETTCEEDVVSNNGEPKQTEMEYILNQYQQMVDSRQQPETKIKPAKGSTKNRKIKTTPNSKINVGQMLKPKIPPSLKQKRASKHNVKPEEKCQKDKDKIEIERITSSVLDTLLHDLQTSGIINDDTKSDIVTSESIQKNERPTTAKSTKNSRNSPRNAANNENNRRVVVENDIETTVSPKSPPIQNLHKNYNYTQMTSSANNTQDSTVSSNSHMDTNQTSTSEDTEKFSKESSSTQYMTQQALNKNGQSCGQGCGQGGQEGDTIKNNIHTVTRNLNCFYNMQDDKEQNTNSNTSPQQWPPQKRTLKYPHDDHTAMELHRSKSYIVNLIDRALSRELGTIPEERTSKQYMNLEARTALDLMSSPAVKNMDNDMCLEITQVLADSISTAPVKDAMPCSSTCSTPKPNCSRGDPSKIDDLVYHPSNDEPMYIKQLKKLRWGHLKHIQREMRRLEDLEKFLDSCSSEK